MGELASQYEIERQAEEAKLLADLAHAPTYTEKLLIENAAALAVRQRWLRKQGRHKEADDVARLLIRTLGRLGIKPGQSPASPDIDEVLAAAVGGDA